MGLLSGYTADNLTNKNIRIPFDKHQCCVISISPLACELLTYASHYNDNYNNNSSEARLLRVLQDQLALLSVEPLMLPKLKEVRLKKMARALEKNPSNNRELFHQVSHQVSP